MDDEQIVKLFFERSEQAVSEAAKLYGARLRRLALSFLDSEQDAEECLNDAYLKAWRSVPPQKPDDLFGYLARLVRCTAFDMIDARKAAKRSAQLVELTAELSDCIPDRSAVFVESELSELISSFLAEQKEYKRQIFVMRYFYGYSVSGIMLKTGFSESKVNTVLSRMRKALREHLKGKGVTV